MQRKKTASGMKRFLSGWMGERKTAAAETEEQMEPCLIWDEQVESSLRRVNTPDSRTSRPSRLQLLRDPCSVHMQTKERQIGLIEPAVCAVIRQAVQGELRWPLVLIGDAGSGKTCAALCLLDLVRVRHVFHRGQPRRDDD